MAPLSDRLKVLLKDLMSSNIQSFISPKMWKTHRDVLMTNLGSKDSRLDAVLSIIDRRNNRFIQAGNLKEPSPRRRLIALLDRSLFHPFSSDLLRLCWEVDEDKDLLVSTVLEWAASCHRPGHVKVYVAARLIRFWSKMGPDVTGSIFKFLDSATCQSSRRKSAFYHVVSELARSEHFSTPRYLQWLIARGGIYNSAELHVDGPASTRLLAELPLTNVSEGVIDLRTALLGRADLSIDDEEDQIQDCMVFMNRNLPGMQTRVDVGLEPIEYSTTSGLSELPSDLSRTIRSELGLWLRQKVKLQMVQPTIPPLEDWDDSPVKSGTSAISGSEFNTVRRYLEHLEDYSILADVLKIATTSNDVEVLASCSDTLNLHLETFAAIGALNDLFDVLMDRLRALTEENNSVLRTFLVSLSDLASRLPAQNNVAQQLARELARSDRKTAADACSPVSDHMAIVETAEVDFTDEIEKVLASGNSMDQATLERLFGRIILRLQASWEKSPEQQRSCALLLTRLRTFDAKQFDLLMAGWIHRILELQSRPSMMQVFGPLISFGCLALRDVVLSCDPSEKEADTGCLPTSAASMELLCLLVATCNFPDVMTHEETYRLRIKQSHMQKDFPLNILSVTCQAFADAYSGTHAGSAHALETKTVLESAPMYEIYQRLILRDPVGFSQQLAVPLLQCSGQETVAAINSVVDKMLLAGIITEPITTELLLNIADDFSLPFCQVKLASMLVGQEGDEAGQSTHLADFDNAIESAVNAGKTSWASIIPLLDASTAQHLRRRADTQFLSLFPSPKAPSSDDLSTETRITRAENFLRLVGATAHSISTSTPDPGNASLASEIVTALNGTWLLFANTQPPEVRDATLSKWLPLLLSFMTIHVSAFEATKQGNENRAKVILALVAVLLQLQALDVPTPAIAALIEHTFDLALILADGLPEDLRLQCIRSLQDTTCNPQISYILSIAANPTEWLMLSQKEKAPVIPGANAAAPAEKEKLTPFVLRRWEMLGEPTPNVGENDTSLSLTLFGARRG